MGRIHRLDKKVAALIAAGEVVERPSSVVKELLENAIDSGARVITAEIRRGGLELIRISDDGCGIASEDIPTAFLRHATSKIATEDDLEAIETLGFRGEALASIAAVSRIQLFTRTGDDVAGSVYTIEGGESLSLEEAGCPKGTTIIVRELFYNTPARMKFIKKDLTEANYVQTVLRKAALSHPEISFKLIKDGETVLQTPGDNRLYSAIYCIYGGRYAAGLCEAGGAHSGVKVTGYVSKPESAQGNRTKQEFFVNRRPVRSQMLTAALEEAYKTRMMQGRFPSCVLNIAIAPSLVDVNVHPAKTEVKFAYEREVFDAVYIAVKSAVESGHTLPEVAKTDSVRMSSTPLTGSGTARVSGGAGVVRTAVQTTMPTDGATRRVGYPEPSIREEADSTEKQTAGVSGGLFRQTSVTYDFKKPEKAEQVYPADNKALPETVEKDIAAEAPPKNPAISDWTERGEAFGLYILVQRGDELIFIDKHAAHERIIYEKLVEADGPALAQMLLEPQVIRPEPAEREALLANSALLADMGVEAEDFGGGSLIVRSLPEGVPPEEAEALLGELAESILENRGAARTALRERTLQRIACRAAMKAGGTDTPEERKALVERVLEYEDIKYCPHGRPVAAVLKKSELERRFGRG